MIIYFGADHRGFELKNHLQEYLRNQGYQTADLGATQLDAADDYPAYASAVAKKIALDPETSRGVLICGSGAGVDIVANKFQNVRVVNAQNSHISTSAFSSLFDDRRCFVKNLHKCYWS